MCAAPAAIGGIPFSEKR
ncbi:hypothetical protein D027_4401A, partial [Vibrio parahaemolyticus 861]